MKKQTILFLFLMPCLAFGYNWTLMGPSGIKTYDICFNGGSAGYTVICTAAGICVNDGPGASWNTYSNGGMPAWEAIYFDNTDILLVMGDGSFSDGIYKFNLFTHQFTVMEFVASPTFIKYCTTNQTYYAGSKYDGLMTSVNGTDWNAVPFFISQQVKSMDFRENNFVLTTGFQFQCIYNSSDTGKTWNHTNGNGNFLTCIAFHPNGKLYGIIPNSNSASLRESTDYGQNWNVCYWTSDVNTVGFDAVGNVLVGFMADGIAKYDTVLSMLTFYNQGLPDKCVNRICVNPIMSSITIFCCTNSGVYSSNNYWMGMPDHTGIDEAINIRNYPNPCTSMTTIEFDLPEFQGNTLMLSIYNSTGTLLAEEPCRINRVVINSVRFNVTRFPAGVYYYRVRAGKYDVVRKMVVEKGNLVGY